MNPRTNNSDRAVPSIAEERQAQALNDFLSGVRSLNDPELPAGEAALAADLRLLARESHPDPNFATSLGALLADEARRARRRLQVRRIGQAGAWAIMALVLLFGLSWAIPNLLPRTGAQPTASATETPGVSPTPTVGELPVMPQPETPPASNDFYVVQEGDTCRGIAALYGISPEALVQANGLAPDCSNLTVGQQLRIPGPGAVTATPEIQVPPAYTSILSDQQLLVQAAFPDAPTEVSLYQQLPLPPVDPQAAAALAARLGLPETAYQPLAPVDDRSRLIFSDGYGHLEFTASTWDYRYVVDGSRPANGERPLPLTSDTAALVEASLKQRGLLDFSYQVAPLDLHPGGVNFIPLLDGLPVYLDGSAGSAVVQARAYPDGQVHEVISYLPQYEPLGRFGIINAVQAWQKILTPNLVAGAAVFQSPRSGPAQQAWQRAYTAGEPVTMYGYLEVLKPANQNSPAPLIFMSGIPLQGKLDGLASVDSQQLVEVTGRFEAGTAGQRRFQVDSWQVSPLADANPTGTYKVDGGSSYLVTSDTQYLLPDAPSGLADGTLIMVSGVVLDGERSPVPGVATLDWRSLYTGPFGGGGGGGGPSFAPLILDGSAPLPTPTPAPVETIPPGKRLDGVTGSAWVLVRKFSDGSRAEVSINLDDSPEMPGGMSLQLEGPLVEELEPYHLLPVRIWGEFTTADLGQSPQFRLERFEPVYEDVKMQAWFGTLEQVMLTDPALSAENKLVLRLTTQEGEQYILKSSIDYPSDISWLDPGKPVVVEGAIFPGVSFGGLPVMQDSVFIPVENTGVQDLSQYQLQYVLPQVVEETGSVSGPRQATIETIELVYFTTDQRWAMMEGSTAPLYVQPAWRFAGHTSDGGEVVIYVQALQDQYLNPAAIYP